MPIAHTYPGVYIQEVNGVGSIVGVSTSDTVFIDFFARGPVNVATRITSFDEFNQTFGGLDQRSEASYGIQQFFLNGGSVAWVVRVVAATQAGVKTVAAAATLAIVSGGTATLNATAATVGAWGGASTSPTTQIQIGVDVIGPGGVAYSGASSGLFNMVVRLVQVPAAGSTQPVVLTREVYRGVTMDKTQQQYVVSLVNSQSSLIKLADATGGATNGPLPTIPTTATGVPQNAVSNPAAANWFKLTGGVDGDAPGTSDWNTSGPGILISGFAALDRMAPYTFSLMCIPAAAELRNATDMATVYTQALTYCQTYMAFLLIDIPRAGATSVQYTDANSFVSNWYGNSSIQGLFSDHAAVYFPRLQLPDPLNGYQPRSVASSGTLAGIYSRTDANRGVWKAPAGTETTLHNATVEAPISTGIPLNLTDQENGGLNPYGINAIRNFPIFGTVSWGARTLNGADAMASQWKYVPVRRLALYIEQSLYQGSNWIVFEPNDEPLWGEIRKTFTAFMQSLFLQQAFQGSSPSQAYFVRCDGSTTTQADIDAGVVNILVGFAPLMPAEFVVIAIQQIAGQAST